MRSTLESGVLEETREWSDVCIIKGDERKRERERKRESKNGREDEWRRGSSTI